jgi:dihydroorotase
MKHIFQNVTVIDKKSPYHNKKTNILINGDQIIAIGEDVADHTARSFNLEGCMVSPGWVELHSNFADPGFEEREDIISGAKAAAAGGFTGVALVPSTQPVTQGKGDIDYFLKRGEETSINIYPLGALSRNLQGEELTEMFDMQKAGALAFYDDKMAIKNPNVLKTALLYSNEIAPVFVHPRHPDLTQGGQMNEGKTSTFLGLKGIPAFAEELSVSRDLFIAQYTNSSIHFTGISTRGSVNLIREAKEKGQQVTADVNFYSLILDDSVLEEYDTNFKLNPPLRSTDDIDALIEGLKDGTIDAIAIDHVPHEIESKRCEFDHAAFGMAAIETAFASLKPCIKKIGLPLFIEKISNNPRLILGVPEIKIIEGSIAELTFFKQDEVWILNAKNTFSKALNNPFLEKKLSGKVMGIFNKGKFSESHKGQ